MVNPHSQVLCLLKYFELVVTLHEWVDHLVCNYIPMPENTPYIVTHSEAIHPLHFYAHSFLHESSYTFVLNPHFTPVHSFYMSSTPTLVMMNIMI